MFSRKVSQWLKAHSVVEDVRGYGVAIVERLKKAFEKNCPASPDPRHPNLYVMEREGQSFYIAPLPSGKVLLLAHWQSY